MQTDVRPFSGKPADFFRAGILAFGEHPRDEELTDWEPRFEADRAFAAYDGDRIVGTAGSFGFQLTVPGGVLPAAGVTIVGVQPTHRRRGILRRMMRAQLDAIHDLGEPLAILWASEGNIYQRFGYGLGSLRAGIDVPRDRNAFRTPHQPAGSVRYVDLDDAKRLFPPIFESVRTQRPGAFARTDAYWTHDFFPDPEHWRKGAGAAFHVVHETHGAPDGYARYRIKEEWDTGPNSALQIVELMASNPAAHRDLWRFLLDIDLVGHVDAWNLPTDDPIVLLVAEPRRLKSTFGDGLWLRVVD
ncbi:MAG TPA: GNAT family N-acetyltransferase, partial [Vitreimonas sp.]|nr:GNAT family N-acetyltransferase [Vitreimonas sp.]